MSFTRRDFIRTASIGGSVLILPRGLRAQGVISPNARLQLAVIGAGGRGRTALNALQDEQIVAFCDVDHARAREPHPQEKKVKNALNRFPDAKWFHDYRVMFERMADQIDAVVISVPDHMHFAIAMTAIKHGKHVYVEKPLCHCVTEVRALHAAARKAGVVTQMGNQGRAAEGIRLAREWVQAGLLGHVHTVHAWTNRSMGGYSHPADVDAAPPESPPSSLHYDLWLGVAPERPYRKIRSHGSWRGCAEYGGGTLGDWGCHQMDAAFYALDLGLPISVEAATTEPKKNTFPVTITLTYRFAARPNRPPVELKWFDGGLLPPQPVDGFKFDANGGSIFYGEKGIMWVNSHSASARLLPEKWMQDMRGALPPKTIPRVTGGPHIEWVNAIRNRTRCGSDFDYAAPLAEIVLLGVAAVRARTRLEWDAKNARVTNHAFANQFIGPGFQYRPGWGV
ncbi:MAG: Gfo/Idh/MocA family oxidoreductase [Opitutaceae bacterium]|nr:Gfo/Idh/MocA family oxidoreductase [Opitutaceae bacterium]